MTKLRHLSSKSHLDNLTPQNEIRFTNPTNTTIAEPIDGTLVSPWTHFKNILVEDHVNHNQHNIDNIQELFLKGNILDATSNLLCESFQLSHQCELSEEEVRHQIRMT